MTKELIHEGKKYEAKEIDGQICFVPVENIILTTGTVYELSSNCHGLLISHLANGHYSLLICDKEGNVQGFGHLTYTAGFNLSKEDMVRYISNCKKYRTD